MKFALRVSLPDRPGQLGRLATALSRGGANIVSLDVVDRTAGEAIDDLVVEAADGLTDALMRVVVEAPDAIVEAARPIAAFPQALSPLELAVRLAECEEDPLAMLVDNVPGSLWSSWCVAVRNGGGFPEAVAMSPCSPPLSQMKWPRASLERATRLHPGEWMPAGWRMGRLTYEVAAAPLDSDLVVMTARRHGPRFRPNEVTHLGLLARITASQRQRVAVGSPPAAATERPPRAT